MNRQRVKGDALFFSELHLLLLICYIWNLFVCKLNTGCIHSSVCLACNKTIKYTISDSSRNGTLSMPPLVTCISCSIINIAQTKLQILKLFINFCAASTWFLTLTLDHSTVSWSIHHHPMPDLRDPRQQSTLIQGKKSNTESWYPVAGISSQPATAGSCHHIKGHHLFTGRITKLYNKEHSNLLPLSWHCDPLIWRQPVFNLYVECVVFYFEKKNPFCCYQVL